MTLTATLLATVRIPGDRFHLTTVGRRPWILVPAGGTLRVYDLGVLVDGQTDPVAVFPAPWPDGVGGRAAVSPDLDFAVFPGVHAVRAVERSGALRWELRHSCWEASCVEIHAEYADYAGTRDHKYPDNGSVWVSTDRTTVWAHVRGPLAGEDVPEDYDPFDSADERWIVASAADGRVLGSVPTETAAHGSFHLPHPRPDQLALSIGEGQDGSPLFWGRFDGHEFTAERLGDDCIGLAVAPNGQVLISVGHSARGVMNVHALPAGTVTGSFFAEQVTGDDDHRWNLGDLGFLDADRLVAATSRHGNGDGGHRHWLLDTGQLTVTEIRYPEPVTGRPLGLGDGTWLTAEGPELRLWRF